MELSITQDAAEEFNKSVEGIEPKPYLRVGATKGGCSGWTFSSGHWLGLGLSLVGWVWVVVLWVGFGLLSCGLGCVWVA